MSDVETSHVYKHTLTGELSNLQNRKKLEISFRFVLATVEPEIVNKM